MFGTAPVVLQPPSAGEMLKVFTNAELGPTGNNPEKRPNA
jgi:hypothetical protein